MFLTAPLIARIISEPDDSVYYSKTRHIRPAYECRS
jgi:hypothetical protein